MKRHVDFILDSFDFDATFVRPHFAILAGFCEMDYPQMFGDYGALVSLAIVALFEAGYLTYPEFAELYEVLKHD